MHTKRRFVVFVVFAICLFFLMTFAGGRNNEIIATRTVEFVDGFNNETISLQTVEVGKDAEVPEDPKHKDYVFAGWYLFDDHDVEVTDFKNILEDLKVIALYAGDKNNNGIADENDQYYTVKFVDTITNTVIDEQKVLSGLDAQAPSAPKHKGYTFRGWSTGYSNVQADLTVNALYRTNVVPVVTYKVTFIDGDTNKVIEVQEIEKGLAATLPVPPKHEGRVLDYWDGEYYGIIKNTIITAVYTDDKNNDGIADYTQPHYSVVYYDYDYSELGKFVNVLVNLATPTVDEPTREYYEFTGWDPEVADTVTATVTYKATYKPINDKNDDGTADEEQTLWEVRFYGFDGTTQIGNVQYILDGKAAVAPKAPEVSGYAFVEWKQDFSSITSNLNVYSKYEDVEGPAINATVEMFTAQTKARVNVVVTDNEGVKTVKYLAGENTLDKYSSATELTLTDGKYYFDTTSNGIYTIYAEDINGNISVEYVDVNEIIVNEGTIEDSYAEVTYGKFIIGWQYKKDFFVQVKTKDINKDGINDIKIVDARYNVNEVFAGEGFAYDNIEKFINNPSFGKPIAHDGSSFKETLTTDFSLGAVTVYVKYEYLEETAPGVFEVRTAEKLYKTKLSIFWGE